MLLIRDFEREEPTELCVLNIGNRLTKFAVFQRKMLTKVWLYLLVRRSVEEEEDEQMFILSKV